MYIKAKFIWICFNARRQIARINTSIYDYTNILRSWIVRTKCWYVWYKRNQVDVAGCISVRSIDLSASIYTFCLWIRNRVWIILLACLYLWWMSAPTLRDTLSYNGYCLYRGLHYRWFCVIRISISSWIEKLYIYRDRVNLIYRSEWAWRLRIQAAKQTYTWNIMDITLDWAFFKSYDCQ